MENVEFKKILETLRNLGMGHGKVMEFNKPSPDLLQIGSTKQQLYYPQATCKEFV